MVDEEEEAYSFYQSAMVPLTDAFDGIPSCLGFHSTDPVKYRVSGTLVGKPPFQIEKAPSGDGMGRVFEIPAITVDRVTSDSENYICDCNYLVFNWLGACLIDDGIVVNPLRHLTRPWDWFLW